MAFGKLNALFWVVLQGMTIDDKMDHMVIYVYALDCHESLVCHAS